MDDILILVNDTGHAPVIRGLQGNLIFDEGKAELCFSNAPNLDRLTRLQIKLHVQANGASEVVMSDSPCRLESLEKYDAVVVDRGDLLNGRREIAQTLLDAIGKNELSQIAVLSHKEVQVIREEQKNQSLELADNIQKSAVKGYGIVYVHNGSAGICRGSAATAIRCACSRFGRTNKLGGQRVFGEP